MRHDVAIETHQTLERQQGRAGRRESGVCLEIEQFEPDDYSERRQIRQKNELALEEKFGPVEAPYVRRQNWQCSI